MISPPILAAAMLRCPPDELLLQVGDVAIVLGKPPIHLVFQLIQPGIYRISFKKVRFKDLCCPTAEQCCIAAIDAISNGQNRIKIVKHGTI